MLWDLYFLMSVYVWMVIVGLSLGVMVESSGFDGESGRVASVWFEW